MSHAAQCLLKDQDYMNADQLQYFRQRLQAWRQELNKSLQHHSHPLAVDTRVPDWLDSAALRTEQDLGHVKRQRVVQTLREIEAALLRIDSGDYGYCYLSGEEIGLERLVALPIACFSVASQEELEQRRRTHR